jgi:hypothetical protein
VVQLERVLEGEGQPRLHVLDAHPGGAWECRR